MCRIAFFCAFAIFANGTLHAQYPSLSSYTVSDPSAVVFKYNGAFIGINHMEVPPWIVAGGWKSYFFVNGVDTYVWSSPTSLATNDEIDLNNAGVPYKASESYINSEDYDAGHPVDNWKRDYHNIYSAAYFTHPVAGPVSLGFLHGENKNVVSGHDRYTNTIQQNVPIDLADPLTWTGGNPYHEGWDAYNGIISASWIPNTLKTNWGQQFFKNELGPIAWPATGYVTKGGIKCTAGLRHPSSIIAGNYVYVFYVESGAYGNNIKDVEGRHKGIKVVRAALKDALDPLGYQVYYRDTDSNETWNASLPAGFAKENMLNFVAVRGPKATDLMGSSDASSQEIRFSAAKVRNENYFIGVEQYIDFADAQKYKVALHFSSDLVNWTDRSVIYTADTWEQSRMNYPIFLSNDGWSNTEVDMDDFYILGTGSSVSNQVNRLHILASQISPFATAYTSLLYATDPTDGINPNPGTGLYKLSYTVNTLSGIAISIFDMSGRRLQSLNKGTQRPGMYTEDLDITHLPSGVYLVKIFADNKSHTYKVVKT